MLVFIDESGDPGIKKGCSPYFTVTLLIFEDRDGGKRGRYTDRAI
jgi:hypothetical protein